MKLVNHRFDSGVTLIEVLVVCVIIGILLTMAASSYSGFRDRVSGTGFLNAILIKSREARSLASSLASDVAMKIDLDNDKVWLEVDGKPYGTTIASPNPNIDIGGFELTDGTFVSTGVRTAWFRARGTTEVEGASALTNTPLHIRMNRSIAYNATDAGNDKNYYFRTLLFMKFAGRADSFDVGCMVISGNVTAWGWPQCMSL